METFRVDAIWPAGDDKTVATFPDRFWRGMRTVVTEALGPAVLFVPAEREPAQSLVDRFQRRLGIAFDAGTVDAQDDRPPLWRA